MTRDCEREDLVVHVVKAGVSTQSSQRVPSTGSKHSGSIGSKPAVLYNEVYVFTFKGSAAVTLPLRSLLRKASPAVPATGADAIGQDTGSGKLADEKRRKINLQLNRCRRARFLFNKKFFNKKLTLDNLNLTPGDIPVTELWNTLLGNSLQHLSLSRNRLRVVPDRLVCSLPVLKTLILSHCSLWELPEKWSLPELRQLDLSYNRLDEFPNEFMLGGLPKLKDLNMYGNKVTHIVVPRNPKVLSELHTLNLGYNELTSCPDELDRLPSLRHLKLRNNFLETVPNRVCCMSLLTLDVSSNPIRQPPIERCERGVKSMRQYYECLRIEELPRDKQQRDTPLVARKGKMKQHRQRKREGKLHKHRNKIFNKVATRKNSKSLPVPRNRFPSFLQESSSGHQHSGIKGKRKEPRGMRTKWRMWC